MVVCFLPFFFVVSASITSFREKDSEIHSLFHDFLFTTISNTRTSFLQGGAEREQGLLQILTEMDGFKESTSQVC